MINVFSDERLYSEDEQERTEARNAMHAELVEIQRAEDQYLADLYGEKPDPEEETEEET